MTFRLPRARASARTLASLIGLAASTLAAPAFAHITLATPEVAGNSYYRGTLRVPHGCDGAATTTVRVEIPDDVIGVKPMPKPGWTLKTETTAYKKTYQDHGRSIKEGVRSITWSGGNLPDAFYDEFTFSSFVASDEAKDRVVYFPVTQTCEKGEAAWTEIPAAGQSSHALAKPAPALRITQASPAQGHMHGDAAATASEAKTEAKAGSISVTGAWTRATPSGAKIAGGYLKVTNTGSAADRLVSATSDISGRVEMHEMSMNNGVMQMRPLDAGLEIKPGDSVELKPGGYHMMFMDISRQLKEGDTVKATLTFEKAGKIDVTFKVGSVGAGAAPAEGHHHH